MVDYDPAWPARFEAERTRIETALREVGGVIAIEHVGSTAVPGLAAKPIIDIMIGVREVAVGERCIEPMEGLEYQYRGEAGIPGRHYFRKGSPRSHHVHLVKHSSEFWQNHLLFRDYLRAHEDAAREYAALKRELAQRHRDDRVAYTDAKDPFVKAALENARKLASP